MVSNEFYRKISYQLCVCFFCAGIVACSPKPKEIRLPDDGRLTASEVEAVMQNLPQADRVTFKKWSQRMINGEAYGGESIARTPRQALLNQQTFEKQESEILARAKEKQEAIKAQEQEAQERLQIAIDRRQAVNNAIRESIDATIPTYRPKTFYDRNGHPISGVIEFDLKLRNKAPRTAIGIAGVISITDVFGRDLGSYPFILEPRISPNQTIVYSTTLTFDPRNEQHQILWRTQSIRSTWFFESAAFEGGQRIDAASVASGQAQLPVINRSPKSPNI